VTIGGCLREAVTALRLNALRSALTAIGVIIGVAAIIVMGAAGNGARERLKQQIAIHGANTLSVHRTPAANAGLHGPVVTLTDEDARAIEEFVPDIQAISREVDGKVTIVGGNMSWSTDYWAVEAPYADVYDVKLAEGRFFDGGEVRSGAKVIVLGATVASTLFGEKSPIDKIVRVGGVPAQVIGVRTALGQFAGEDADDEIYVPVTTARSRLPQGEATAPPQLSQIDVKIVSGADRESAKEAILALLRERKHVHEGEQEKFNVFDASQFVELLNATQTTLGGLLAATAAISLVVGGVGIMNIMLVSVTERTHEIGLRMAIGARKRDILAQFLTEAIVLCVAAGAAGLALGVAGGYAVAQAAEWPLIVGLGTVAIAILASVGVGVVFGYLPARRAAALNPIDALRRE